MNAPDPIRPGDTVTCSSLQFSGNWTVNELIPDKHLVHIIHDDYQCWVDLDDVKPFENFDRA